MINLGRLLIREGDGTSAYQLLATLFEALKSRAEVVVDETVVSLRNFVADTRDHHDLVRWLWSVLLADGTRALTRAGRWDEALQHTRQHKGIGERLLDGRQVAILARCAQNAHEDARRTLAATVAAAPWEQAVAACLKVVCLRWSGQEATLASAEMVERYLALDTDPEHAIFHVRLGLCVAALSDDEHGVLRATRAVERTAVEAADAYAANEVLSRQMPLPLTTETSQALAHVVHLSGLARGTMPQGLQDDLIASARASERSIRDILGSNLVGGRSAEIM